MIQDALSVTWKEIQLITRDRGSLAVLLLLPLLFGSLYGSINRYFVAERTTASALVNVCLVNEDTGIFGEQVASAIANAGALNVERLNSIVEAEQRVATGRVSAAIIIPAGFSAAIETHTPTTIDLIIDPVSLSNITHMIVVGVVDKVANGIAIWGEVLYAIHTVLNDSGITANTDAGICQAIYAQNLNIILARLSETSRASRVNIVNQNLEGAIIESGIKLFFALLFPGVTVMFAFFSMAVSGASLLHERETGVLRRLLAAPIQRGTLIAGKMLGYMTLICVQTVLLLGSAHLFFGMPLGRSPVALVLLTLTMAWSATAMGMMIATFSRSSKQADSIGTIMGFVLGGLGGCIAYSPTPLTRTQGLMGTIARLTPHGHAVDAFYSLTGEHATLVEILPQLGILFLMGTVFFLIAIRRFRWDTSMAV